MNMTKKLLILGAGIGGLSVVHELVETGVDLADLDVTVIDEDFSHFLGFTLPWVMRGWRDRDSVAIRPTADALADVETITGAVQHVDPEARVVTLATGELVSFDALVIATGARNAIGRVPGLQDAVDAHTAVHYYSADAAADANRALSEFTGGKLVFLVTALPYRCPVAPYEGAMLAADLLHDNGVRTATQISVHSPEPQPMPSAGPFAGPELVALLNDKGIAFFAEHAVDRVDAEHRTVHFADSSTADYDLLVFVPPHEPALTLGEPGWIGVDNATMQTRYPGIYAIGDTTAVTSPSGRPLPKAAIFAKNGAKAAAANVLNHLGITDATSALSGEGFCYVDVGGGASAQGKGDFFTLPHPAIHLAAPSVELHHDKQDEERDWRALWELAAAPTTH
ncbi:NAD(P)/FAD-dependent oxidoreductase [Mycolicibacterium madagascariense]|nr:NAD(P)/FAD-dependent oxidoreductase [Mycolicibacterium madagascariense]